MHSVRRQRPTQDATSRFGLEKKIHDINISCGKKLCRASNSYSSTSTTLLTLNQFDGRTTDARNDELIFRVCTLRGAVPT